MPTATDDDRAALRLTLGDHAATAKLGRWLATQLRTGDVVGLEGDVGAGKSTLARACLQHLAGTAIEVPSPTFTLIQSYGYPALEVWHVDLYRLTHGDDVRELGLEEATIEAALLIEWPDRLSVQSLRDRLTIRLDWASAGDSRTAALYAGPTWTQRLRRTPPQAG